MKYTPEQIKEKIREGKYNFDFEGTKRGNETRRSAEEIQNEIRNKTYQGIDYDHIAEIKRQVAERNSFVPNKNTSHSNLQRAAEQRIKNEAAQKNSLSNDMSYEEKNKSLRNQEWKAYGKRLLTGLGYIASDENSRDITYRDYQNARQQHKEIKAQHDELKQNRQNEIQTESKRLIEEDAEISNLVKKAYSARATASEKTQNAAQSDDLTSAMMSLFNKDELGYDTSKQDRELKESKKQLNDILKQKNASLDADELIAYYTNNQNILKSQNTAEGFNKAAQEHPVILGAARVLSSPYASIANAATTIGDLVTDGDYVYSGANSIHDARRGIKSGIEDKLSNADLPNLSALPGVDENNDITILDKNYGNVYSSLYDAIDMGAESAYNSLIMGGGLTGGIKARGLSEKIIQAGATGSFTSATMGEQTAQLKASGENIKDVYAETGKDAIINFAGEMIGTPLEKYDGVIPTVASEALEEVIGNAVSNLDDVIRLQDEGEIKQTYNKYIAEGKSESQALSLTVKELLADDIYVAGMAAVSSFGMAGGQSVLNSAQENNIYRSVGNELKKSGNAQAEINAGLAQDNTSKAYQAAAQLQSKLDNSISYDNDMKPIDYSSLSSRKLGRLAEYNAQEDVRQLEKSAEVFEGDTAKSYVYAYGDNGYNGNVYDYNKGFNAVYMAQQQGKSYEKAYNIALDEGSHITPIQATIAYDAAKNDTAVAEFKDALSSPIKIGATVVAKSVDKEQQSTINFIDEMAKLAGVEVVIPARMQDVGLKDANGAYTNGKIVLPLDNESKMMNIYLGHEMFHHFKVTAPESADFLQNTIIEKLKADGSYKYNERLEKIINDYGFEGTREQQVAAAHEEMAANACFTVFSDEANVKQLVAQDRTLAQKVRDFFAGLIDRMKKAIAVISNNAEYRAFSDEESMQEIVDLFDNCLKESQKNNTINNDSVPSTGIKLSKKINDYPYDMQTVIKDYLNSVDDDILQFYNNAINKVPQNLKINIGKVTSQISNEISEVLGVDTEGWNIQFEDRIAKHINKDHGEKGITDKSMADSNDVARMKYVIENHDYYGSAESTEAYKIFENGRNKKAPTITFAKKINGTYYLVMAVPKKKTLWIVTAFMNKKIEAAQFRNASNEPLRHTSKNATASTSTDNVPQSETSVNSNDMQDKAKYALKEHSKHQIENFEKLNKESLNNIKMRNGIIINNESELINVIHTSLDNKLIKNNYSFGAIPNNTIERLINDLGNSINFKNGQYAFVFSSDDIKHISKHFLSENEIASALINLYDTVVNYDNVNIEKNGSQTRLIFKKSYKNANYLSVEIVSNKKRAFDLVTYYITKKNSGTQNDSLANTTKSGELASQGVSSSTNNSISKFNENVKESIKEQPYSYEALTSKPDMKVTEIDDKKDYTPNKTTREDVVNNALVSALSVGHKDSSGNVFVYVDDIDTNVMVSKRGLRHSLDRRLSIIAPVTENIGAILKNSIRINELTPEFDTIEKSYALIGIAKNNNNEPYVVSFIVNKASNEIISVDVLYAVNAKKEATALIEPELSSQSDVSLTASTISISDLLDYVNKYYPDLLPEDVLKHYGYKGRPEGVLGESALYSIKENPIDYNAVIEENAELSEMNEDLKEMLRLTSAQNEKLKNEFKITDRHNISNNAVDKVAAALRKQYSSSYDKTSLVSRLAAMYDYMANAGKDIDSAYIWLRANDIAKNIIANSQQKDTAVYDEYKELRNRIRNTAIRVPQAVQDNFADYNAFRRENFGRLRLSKEGVELDAFYNELSAQYPEFFDVDVSEEQQLEALANFFEVTSPVYYSASEKTAESMGMNMEQYANLIAGDIIDKYFDVPEVMTAAEKHKKEMDTLKLHYRNQIDDMRQSYKYRYDERLREVKAENAKRVTKLRADKADALAKQKAHFEDVSQRGKERRKKSQLRNSIRKSLNKIARLGATPDKKKHIPNSIIDSVKSLADVVTFDDTKQDNRLKERLNAFQDSFEAVEKNDQYSVISELYNDFIHSKLSDLKEEIGNTPLKELPVSTLEKMDELFKMTVQSINNINRLFLKDRNETIEKYAENISNELAPYKKEKMYKGMSKSLMYNSMKPDYFFQYLGSDTLLELYHNLRKGEDVWAVDISEARDYALKVRKKYGWQKWDNKHSQSFNTSYGKIELTLQERLAVYANSLGEHTKNHLYGGGFRYQKSEQKGLKKLRKLVNDNENHRLSESDVELIVSSLDENQKAYVRDMMNYLSTVMGQKGNEVSKELYGIEMFKEKMYYPAKVLKESTHQSTKEVRAEKQLKNAGFTNSSVKNAKQPLVLMDFDSVWASHIDEMSKYHAFVLPLENIDRVYNLYNVTADYEFTSIKQIIENAYGDKALTYIDDLIKDINGGVVHEAGTDFISKATSLFKKNAVFASASVAVQQPSAIARAFSEVDFKYFVKVTGSGFSRKSYTEMKKYAPIAVIKEMGYFDTNMAQSTVDFLNNNDYEGVKEKLKAFVKDGSYRDEALSFFASKADEITWTHIWNACKAEVKANSSELTKEQQLEKAGERFTEVVTKTQVYDSVFSRSGLMRSRDSAVKNATAFMAEPTTSLNMLANAVVQAKRGNISKAKAGRVFASLVTASVFNSLLQTIVTAARADDDDKDWAEVYLSQLIPNFIGNLNPFNQIAFVKDIFNIFQGYDVTRADMNLFSDLYNAIDRLDSDKISTYKKITGLSGAIAAFFGLPVKNVIRDVESAFNVGKDFFDDKKFSSETALDLFKKEMNNTFGFELFNADLDIALKAVKKGDTQTYQEYADKIYATDDAYELLYSVLVKYGYNSSQYRTEENRCVEIKKQNGAKKPNPKSSMQDRAIQDYAKEKSRKKEDGGSYDRTEPYRKICMDLYGDMTKVNEALEKLND